MGGGVVGVRTPSISLCEVGADSALIGSSTQWDLQSQIIVGSKCGCRQTLMDSHDVITVGVSGGGGGQRGGGAGC